MYTEDWGIAQTGGKPYHPMTQGKIVRYDRIMKNMIKQQNFNLPWELEKEIDLFVYYYNHERVHESQENMTPIEVICGRSRTIRELGDMVKEQTLAQCRRKISDWCPGRSTVSYRTQFGKMTLDLNAQLSHLL